MKQEVTISNAEMVIMRVIWSLGEARVSDVLKQVGHRQKWTIATVKTLLGRLVKKQMLSTEKLGRSFVYHARVSEKKTIQLLTEDLMSKVCATNQKSILLEAVEKINLTKADVDELIQVLQNKQTVQKIECNCLDDMENCHCQHHH